MIDQKNIRPSLLSAAGLSNLGMSRHQLNPASWAYERLGRYIQHFQADLDDDHEIGAQLVSFGPGVIIHIESLGYHGPDFVTFYGVTDKGDRVQLVQHLSQINMLLMAVPKVGENAHRIGFTPQEPESELSQGS